MISLNVVNTHNEWSQKGVFTLNDSIGKEGLDLKCSFNLPVFCFFSSIYNEPLYYMHRDGRGG